jgi:hypothetical protein
MQLKLNIAKICLHQHALGQWARRLLSFHQEWRLRFEKLLEEGHYVLSGVLVVWEGVLNLLQYSSDLEVANEKPFTAYCRTRDLGT